MTSRVVAGWLGTFAVVLFALCAAEVAIDTHQPAKPSLSLTPAPDEPVRRQAPTDEMPLMRFADSDVAVRR